MSASSIGNVCVVTMNSYIKAKAGVRVKTLQSWSHDQPKNDNPMKIWRSTVSDVIQFLIDFISSTQATCI